MPGLPSPIQMAAEATKWPEQRKAQLGREDTDDEHKQDQIPFLGLMSPEAPALALHNCQQGRE